VRVHGFHGRTVADVPVDGRRVVVSVQVRRLVCMVLWAARGRLSASRSPACCSDIRKVRREGGSPVVPSQANPAERGVSPRADGEGTGPTVDRDVINSPDTTALYINPADTVCNIHRSPYWSPLPHYNCAEAPI
jgi:hypothetical protein